MKAVVLLVDDQAIVAETVRAMMADAADLELHWCDDPKLALKTAERVKPSVILQDLVMPGVDGLMLVKFFRASAATKNVPIVVLSSTEDAVTKARAFGSGAHDYIVKLPDPIELLARVRHHASAYRAHIERDLAFRQLSEARAHLKDEMTQAAEYAARLLPEPLSGDVSTSTAFAPSLDLGGDMLGFHRLADGRVTLYVLDVSGHGMGAALHGISVATVLRYRALPDTDFGAPPSVLAALCRAFPLYDYGGYHFTIWYGVYDPRTRALEYAVGGHPPALLVSKDGGVRELQAPGAFIGIDPDATFESRSVTIAPGDRVYVYSDGAYEIELAGGAMLGEEAFHEMLLAHSENLDGYVDQLRALRGGEILDDDTTVLMMRFA